MDRRATKRICRLIYVVAVVLTVLGIFAVIGSVLCLANGRAAAMFTLIFGLSVAIGASQLAEAAEHRI